MNKITLVFFFLFFAPFVYSQQTALVFFKKKKEINKYWKGSIIAFQLKNGQWQKGELARIQNDSFYIRPYIVRYNFMGSDTAHFRVVGFDLKDIYAMPNEGILIDYKEGRYQISGAGGHVHWYWIKSGWIFRAGALGYAGLNIANGLIKNNFSFSNSKTQLLTSAAVFLGGVILHKIYKPYLKIGKKYRLEILDLSN
ncbi:MAG: hypothetical protein IPP72_01035 [Chitinophagaceae bacterium]|nr:hypothetical protein [Chitinophagaceae bacterium]